MKTLNSKLILLLAAVTLLGGGCSRNNGMQGAINVNQPILPGGGTPPSPDGAGGTTPTGPNTATFIPVSFEEFNSYVALHPLNNPTDFKITVNLQNAGAKRYAGTVKISYVDNGNRYEANFEAGSGVNQDLYDLKDSNLLEAAYNRWFVKNNKYYFSGFFQDAYGAVVLVIDNYVNEGDVQGLGSMSGSIYYKNFAQSYAKQSPYRKCWYIYDGPYDCRAAAVIYKSSIYPGDGYRKLGTFSGLVKSDVFK